MKITKIFKFEYIPTKKTFKKYQEYKDECLEEGEQFSTFEEWLQDIVNSDRLDEDELWYGSGIERIDTEINTEIEVSENE